MTLTSVSGNFLATNVIITRCNRPVNHKSFEKKNNFLTFSLHLYWKYKWDWGPGKNNNNKCTSISVSHQFPFVLVRCHYKVAGKRPGSCLYRYQDPQCAQGLWVQRSRWFPTHTRSARDRTEGTPMTPGSHCPHPTQCVHSRPLKNIKKRSSTLQSSNSKVLYIYTSCTVILKCYSKAIQRIPFDKQKVYPN